MTAALFGGLGLLAWEVVDVSSPSVVVGKMFVGFLWTDVTAWVDVTVLVL